MKTKSLIMAIAAFSLSAIAYGQDKNTTSTKPANDVTFLNEGLSSHWFIELGDGAMLNTWPKVEGPSFTDRISYINPYIAIGRWNSPYFGTRLEIMGGKQYAYSKFINRNGDLGSELFKNEMIYANAHLDFMFDVVNYFAPYRADRIFHLVPYLGIGAGYVGKTKMKEDTYTKNEFLPILVGGVQLKFRLGSYADFNIDLNSTASTRNEYVEAKNNHKRYYGINLMDGIKGGFTFYFGKNTFTPVTPMDYALVDQLNNQINQLRSENEELAKRPVSCPECPEVMPNIKNVVVGNVVYFRINSAKVDPNQMINIYNTAEWAKGNTQPITLVGYADKDTGTPAYNMQLSKRRAESVKRILVKKYHISPDRIKISWEGCSVQPYAENIWNRIVIMNSPVE